MRSGELSLMEVFCLSISHCRAGWIAAASLVCRSVRLGRPCALRAFSQVRAAAAQPVVGWRAAAGDAGTSQFHDCLVAKLSLDQLEPLFSLPLVGVMVVRAFSLSPVAGTGNGSVLRAWCLASQGSAKFRVSCCLLQSSFGVDAVLCHRCNVSSTMPGCRRPSSAGAPAVRCRAPWRAQRATRARWIAPPSPSQALMPSKSVVAEHVGYRTFQPGMREVRMVGPRWVPACGAPNPAGHPCPQWD